MVNSTKKQTQEEITYTVSSGNFFADLGLPNAEERMAKVDLTVQIIKNVKKKKLSKTRVATLLEIDQPQLSLLMRGQISGFSLEILQSYYSRLSES